MWASTNWKFMDVFVEDTLGGITTTISITIFRFIYFAVGLYPTSKECGFYAHTDKALIDRATEWFNEVDSHA